MRDIPVQMVILDLEDGQRGVFFGRPLVGDDEDSCCQVENVWFTDIQRIPECSSLEELALMVIEQFNAQQRKLQ